ncbi:hypothetical protein JKP88DRAFT_349163 [Tribonema minus]|uniref:Uncharacterized protein n=1 Tax=Tribonema minus TaxID=303371 RepID=A0A835YUP5_9STRA|nr:hypothetical protein JKP88DRAFT_349163 [Tribonema minus]
MARSAILGLLLAAGASAFIMPAAPRVPAVTCQVASAAVADAVSTDIDYESQIKKMEMEAKERIKKAFDEATVKSDAEAKERWAALEEDMRKAAASVGL